MSLQGMRMPRSEFAPRRPSSSQPRSSTVSKCAPVRSAPRRSQSSNATVEMPVDRTPVGVEAVVVRAELLAAHDSPEHAVRVVLEPRDHGQRAGGGARGAVAGVVVTEAVDRQLHERVRGVSLHRAERVRVRRGRGGRAGQRERGEEGGRDEAHHPGIGARACEALGARGVRGQAVQHLAHARQLLFGKPLTQALVELDRHLAQPIERRVALRR